MKRAGTEEPPQERRRWLDLSTSFPWWFLAVVILGVVMRAYLLLATTGTYDVSIWHDHATSVLREGLVSYYHENIYMNHPPAIAIAMAALAKLSLYSGIDFRILLRLPTSLFDAGTATLLFHMFSGSRYRLLVTSAYWLHPIALIFSAYHGNTDSIIAFFLLTCLYLLCKDKVLLAGTVLGISTWVKLPSVLVAPAILFWLPTSERRARFALAAAAAGIVTYIPVLVIDPVMLLHNVFGYGGQIIQTTSGLPVWGTRIFLRPILQAATGSWQWVVSMVEFYFQHNTTIILTAVIAVGWARRTKRSTVDLGATFAFIYTILYGLSNFWSFQYFTWSVPFWFFAGPVFFLAATVSAGGYIYALYAYLTDSFLLHGRWDFIGHPYWPQYLVALRDIAVLFFAATALVILFDALRSEFTRLLKVFTLRFASSNTQNADS